MRPERQLPGQIGVGQGHNLHPLHPALREKGSAIGAGAGPRRTIELEARVIDWGESRHDINLTADSDLMMTLMLAAGSTAWTPPANGWRWRLRYWFPRVK
jgi:hypothetical protein